MSLSLVKRAGYGSMLGESAWIWQVIFEELLAGGGRMNTLWFLFQIYIVKFQIFHIKLIQVEAAFQFGVHQLDSHFDFMQACF